jgi:hypothetical protein
VEASFSSLPAKGAYLLKNEPVNEGEVGQFGVRRFGTWAPWSPFFNLKKIKFKCFKENRKNTWMEPTVYTTIVQNCNTKYLVFCPRQK